MAERMLDDESKEQYLREYEKTSIKIISLEIQVYIRLQSSA